MTHASIERRTMIFRYGAKEIKINKLQSGALIILNSFKLLFG